MSIGACFVVGRRDTKKIGGVTQAGSFETGGEAAVLTPVNLPVDEQDEAILEAELQVLGGVLQLFTQRGGHGPEAD